MNSDGTFTEVTLFGGNGKRQIAHGQKPNSLHVTVILPKTVPKKKNTAKIFCGFMVRLLLPVYGKNKMTSFERYFIDDESTWVEIKDEYYHLIEKPSVCNKILCEFGIDPNNFSHIINGHVPVKIKKAKARLNQTANF